jgi:hypothetical protein
MDTWVWTVIAVAAVVVIFVAYTVVASRRRQALRQGFGTEYDRALEHEGSRRAGESELRERLRRHDEFELRPLDRDERLHFVRAWDGVQASFVDKPADAVGDADRLIQDVMRARGYPVEDFDQRSADLSVDHPSVVENYRNGHALAERSSSGQATTEELRRAMVHYRSLFEELVGVGETTEPSRPSP